MSSHSKVTVTCPKCKKEHPFGIWRSINTVLNPEMKAAVKDGSAFLFECPSCGEKTYVYYDFLYHQMENKIMIYYVNSDENAENVYKMLTGYGPTGMPDMRNKNYLIRIVRTQNELREKIAIFDEGLDDRIIEICKTYIRSKFLREHPDIKEIDVLYFKDDDKNFVQIFADGKPQGVAEIPEKFYEELYQQYINTISDIRKDKPFINRHWALETVNLPVTEVTGL